MKDKFYFDGLPSKQEEFSSCADCPFVVFNTIGGDICSETGFEVSVTSGKRNFNCPFVTK